MFVATTVGGSQPILTLTSKKDLNSASTSTSGLLGLFRYPLWLRNLDPDESTDGQNRSMRDVVPPKNGENQLQRQSHKRGSFEEAQY